ncbi:hypothetical protein ACQ4PT_012972 [Festuca glaucescens]
MKVFYCIPMLTIEKNGLREIIDEVGTNFMNTLVDIGQHYFKIYLDHDQSMSLKNYDDVVNFPVAPLPPVISPSKSCTSTQPEMPASQIDVHDPECIPGRTRQSSRKRTISELVSKVSGEDKDSDAKNDSDFDCVDSDYEVSKGDDDLYADNVDEESDDDQLQSSVLKRKFASAKGKGQSSVVKVHSCASTNKEQAKTQIEDNESDEEDLWAPESDDETMHLRFKFFREADLTNPKFYVGQVFSSVELLRKAVRTYSCIHRKDIKFLVNDKKRVNAKCGKQCSWYLWASYDIRTKGYMIKRYEPKHSCSGKWKVYSFTANFIAEKYLESFRADQDMNLKNFSRVVQKGWNMTPGRSKLQRARRVAMKVIYGDKEQQYKILWDYANEIRRSNPGSSFYLSLDENARFKQCYMCLDASRRGFLEGCRPVIFIDGCHIKTRYRGQLLTAVGMDPNDCIFPIAIAAVEVEDTNSWKWFLETLKGDLGIINTTPWTIMSDKQKV